jgi:hypothetical protein
VHARLEPGAAWDDVAAALGGDAGLDARPVDPSLEDVFIHLVHGDG